MPLPGNRDPGPISLIVLRRLHAKGGRNIYQGQYAWQLARERPTSDIAIMRMLIAVTALATAQAAVAANATYSWCQYPKDQGKQLTGCPNGTIYVSQTDPQAQYGTVRTVEMP